MDKSSAIESYKGLLLNNEKEILTLTNMQGSQKHHRNEAGGHKSLFIHLLVDGHLNYVYFMDLIYKVVMNINVKVF